MNKYINADKLIAEIDNIIEMAEERWDNEQVTGAKKLRNLLGARITSLQQEQPEVDLEKEVERYTKETTHLSITHKRTPMDIMESDWVRCAYHFYELGKNARKK